MRFRRRAVPALIALLALVVVGLAGQGAGEATYTGAQLVDPSSDKDNRTLKEIFDHLRDDMIKAVPPGTRVYPAGVWDLWRHRLIESAIMAGAVIVLDPAQADVQVSLGPPVAPNHFSLVVERLR